jgi:hypothetical protein
MITATPAACDAAQACKGKRFLSSNAPLLPLAGCDVMRCDCRYRHYDDRRAGPRRQDEKSVVPVPSRDHINRRTRRGRRTID